MTATATPPETESGLDPVTVEIIRHSLNSAANQMKRALVRTAFSPVIYEVLDFAVAIYDRQVRLLAQAPSLPIFMGTMSFCVQSAVDAVGGESQLKPGDVILYNVPFGTGSHQPDAAVVLPVFHADGQLLGYTAIKGHWLDIGAKEPYSTDTVDVFQEGTVYPGVKIYAGGVLNNDLYRMVIANSRMPKALAGDLNAEIVGCRAGAEALSRLVERYGHSLFSQCIEQMYDHSEAVIRDYLAKIPDGRYTGVGEMDNNGVEDAPVPFQVTVEVSGSDIHVDFTNAPCQQPGPINCPRPSTVSAARIAIGMLAGGGQAPNEGQFRPVRVSTTPGSLFEPHSPSPTFLYGWPCIQAIDVIYRAIADAVVDAVPAGNGGDICSLVWWGVNENTGQTWVDGSPHPVGQGGSARGDGGTMMHVSESATRFSPIEVWEARNPWLVERVELAQDSAGAGEHQGGQGIDMHFRMRADAWVTAVVDRTRNAPWGLVGGASGRPNSVAISDNDTVRELPGKVTRLHVPKGATFRLHTGGGGGYGPQERRSIDRVRADLADGLVSESFVAKHYPHAVAAGPIDVAGQRSRWQARCSARRC